MESAVVVARGPQLFLVGPATARATSFPVTPRNESAVDGGGIPDRLPAELAEALRGLPTETSVRASSEGLGAALQRASERPISVASIPELRFARSLLPPVDRLTERRFLLAVARTGLERALRSPEEVLITLAREEERLERAVGREARAAESFPPVAGSSLAEYAREWKGVRASLDRHHERLEGMVREQARLVVPNLSAVVGERSAARLVSAAGGVAALARMRAGRIQLLGSRRRPSPDRGPRHGILYRADGMDDVPAGRRGAYARSLGAIAAIAIRADATTRRAISEGLVARRDRRIAQLRSRRG